MSRLRRKVPNWVWEHLDSLDLDEPKPTDWFVTSLREHWDTLRTTKHINNKYWDCSPQGVSPIIRVAGFKNVGFDNTLNQTLWFK